MAKLSDLQRAADRFKAIVADERGGGWHECRVEAPAGFVWAGSGLHELVDSTHMPWRPDYDDLMTRMGHGIVPCMDPECEWCRPEGTLE